jgi:hypothetical protein
LVLRLHDLLVLPIEIVEDVERRLAFHPGPDRETSEVIEGILDRVIPGVADLEDAVLLAVLEEDRAARLQAHPIAHILGDDDLSLRPDLPDHRPPERRRDHLFIAPWDDRHRQV